MSTAEKAKKAIEWIDGLSTTEERQAREKLGDQSTGFCCLGYGCWIHGIKYNPGLGDNSEFAGVVGLRSNAGHYYTSNGKEVIDADIKTAALVALNDTHYFTFKEIAERLKSSPRRYFKGRVGDAVAKHYRSQK